MTGTTIPMKITPEICEQLRSACRTPAPVRTRDRACQYVLVCHYCSAGGVPSVSFTYWGSRAEAQAACDELAPHGGPECLAHTIAAVVCIDRPSRHPAGRGRNPYRTNEIGAKR